MLPGRSREVERIDRLLSDTRRGSGGTLVLRGEAGIGKTELLGYAARAATDMRVLSASGLEAEAELPFAGLFDTFRSIPDDELDRLVATRPDEGARSLLVSLREGMPVAVDRFAVCTAVLRLVCAAAERAPVLVCVDDVQWLDAASADALLFTAHRVRHDPVAMIFAHRDDERPVSGLRGFEEHQLQGLDDPAIGTLLGARLDRPPDPRTVARLVEATGGNPLAVIEWAGRLTDAQLRGWEPLPDDVPLRHRAKDAFEQRIADLDDADRAALLLLAVRSGGAPALVWQVAAVAGIEVQAYERLESAALVRFEQGNPVPVHPLVRSAAVAASPPPEVRSAHSAWAAVLGRLPDGRERGAWHLAAAAIGPDPAAAAALDDASRSASAISAYGTAAAALERAAGLTTDPASRADRLLRAGVAARLAGSPDKARNLLEEAAQAVDDPELRAEIDCERGRRNLYHGHTSEASRLVEQGADRLREIRPDRAASMLGIAAFTSLMAGDVPRSIALAREARGLPGVRADTADPIVDLTLGTALFHAGDIAGSFETLLAAADDVEHRMAEVDPDYVCFAVLALTWIGEYDRARRIVGRVVREARATSSFGVLAVALYSSCYLEARTGRLVPAYAAADEGVRTAEAASNDLWRYFSLGCLAYVEAAQGREKECRVHAREALELARRMDIRYPAPVSDALGMLELALGRPEAAIEYLEPVNRRSAGGPVTIGRPTGPDLVEAYVRAGRDVPPSALGEVVAMSGDARFPALAAVCWRCRGMLAPEDEIDGCFDRALALHEQASNPFALARTLLCHGERLRRAGRRVDARRRLRAAHDQFESLGAVAWVARTEAELQATGDRSRARSTGSVSELTPQELQVALAVARDMSNREVAGELFLSPKTVEFHLSNIYRKLSIRSRAGLASLLTTPVSASDR